MKTWRIIDVINWGVKYFSSKGFDNPRLEIEIFLQYILNCEKINLYIDFEKEFSHSNLKKLKDVIKRRTKKEPIQYIIGEASFYGRDFKVNKNVLIPRPETEIIINVSIEFLSTKKNPFIVDVGTGSGCIGITLAKEFPSAQVIAIDYSESILDIARENSKSVGAKNIEFIKFDFLKENFNYLADLVVSNPPYISCKEMSSLMVDVKEYEPHIALSDKMDGLEFYRVFSNKLNNIIKDEGSLIVEVGNGDHPLKVKRLFEESGHDKVEMIKDYNKDIRVLKVIKG
ncbi:MAG: peptide chain release factor N(5)-glutamine methyltransferase [Candidatus Neomarinimicrobiota bacterium]